MPAGLFVQHSYLPGQTDLFTDPAAFAFVIESEVVHTADVFHPGRLDGLSPGQEGSLLMKIPGAPSAFLPRARRIRAYIDSHLPQDPLDILFHFRPRIVSVVAFRQEVVVFRLPVPDMGDHRQTHRFFVQPFCRCRPADPAAVFPTRMFGYLPLSSGGTSRKHFSHPSGELSHVLTVQLLSPRRFPFLAPCPDLAVRQAFLLRLCQGRGFNQQPLPFIPFPGLAPFQDHGGQDRMLPGAPGQGRVAGGKIDQVIQVRAGEAQDPFVPGQRDPGMAAEVFAALGAG